MQKIHVQTVQILKACTCCIAYPGPPPIRSGHYPWRPPDIKPEQAKTISNISDAVRQLRAGRQEAQGEVATRSERVGRRDAEGDEGQARLPAAVRGRHGRGCGTAGRARLYRVGMGIRRTVEGENSEQGHGQKQKQE